MRAAIRLSLGLFLFAACGDDDDPRDPGEGDGAVLPDADGSVPRDASMDGSLDGGMLPSEAGPQLADAMLDAVTDASFPVPSLVWSDCVDGAFQCATLPVPVDYADPLGETLDIAVLRRPATGQRIGSLLWNPGGPGGSTIALAGAFTEALAPDIQERFDIVSFDPRGVGLSTPIECHDTLQALVATDPSPDDDAEWSQLDTASRKFAQDCAAAYPTLLPHMTSANVARDMDVLRRALGDDELTYLGFSYGAGLGQHYAALFPDHVRALVLDAPADLSLSSIEAALTQAKGFEDALAAYFAWCEQDATRCGWTTGMAPAAAFDALRASVEVSPIPTAEPARPCGPGELTLGVIYQLYGDELAWRDLSDALQRASAGDGDQLVAFADAYLERDADGTYANITEAGYAVDCVDEPPTTLAEIRAQEARARAEVPRFGLEALTLNLVCAHWPVAATARTVPASASASASPILVIGTTGDPATPYAGAQATAQRFSGARLLTLEDEGHTAYLRGNTCIDEAVDAYLLAGTLPAEGTRCPGQVLPKLVPGPKAAQAAFKRRR